MFILSYIDEAIRGPREQPPDMIIKITGAFGLYHWYLCALLFLCKFPIGFHQLAILFLTPPVVYTCGEDTKTNVCPCPKPVYNRSIFTNTLTMDYNLICERKWMASFNQTIFQFGTLVGSMFFGMLSDRIGRRIPLIMAITLQIIFGISAAYVQTYEWFTLFRFVIGFTLGGNMVVSFVILMEFIAPKHREVVSAVYQSPFNMGHMMVPMFAYFYRDYKTFQLALSLPEIILLIYYVLLPETPRWLIAMKKNEKAIKILTTVAKMNKRPVDTIREDVLEYQRIAEKNKLKKGTIIDLFRYPNLRKRNLAMAFNWLSCSYCYYGVSQLVGTLSGNIFVNVLCSAGVSLLGTYMSIPLMKLMGRKTLIIGCHVVCSACLICLAIFSEGIISVICASIGMVTSFIVFVVVYLYCGEMFPTVVRNAAVGFSSMTARIGSMIAPFVIELKDIRYWLCPLVFAIVPFLAIFITMILPETKGCQLTTTIQEGEDFATKKNHQIKSKKSASIKSNK